MSDRRDIGSSTKDDEIVDEARNILIPKGDELGIAGSGGIAPIQFCSVR